MLKNSETFLQLCKGLKLPLNGDVCTNTDFIVRQIYEKYFEEKVCSKSEDAPKVNYLNEMRRQRTNQTTPIVPTAEDAWIFGYGSLVWKADFPYIDRRRGYICGYQRRFYQHSIDHRGTSDKPGRVVTLLATDEPLDRVYGVAYRIAASQKKDVLDHLDYREKNGYERCMLEFHQFPDRLGVKFDIIMYVATHENDSYAGHLWQLPVIADQIFTSAGPSGSNREYLFNLANAMRDLFPGVRDDHLFELEKLVRQRIARDEKKMLESVITALLTEIIADANKDGNVNVTVRDFHTLLESCAGQGWKEPLLTKEMQRMKAS